MDTAQVLCDACWSGDLATVLTLLNDSNINCLNDKQQTPLYCAARQGHIDIVIELLNTPKVNIDSVVPTNLSTALHGQDTTVALLLVKGANDALQNKDQLLAFQEAMGNVCATFSKFKAKGILGLLKEFPEVYNIRTSVITEAVLEPHLRSQKLRKAYNLLSIVDRRTKAFSLSTLILACDIPQRDTEIMLHLLFCGWSNETARELAVTDLLQQVISKFDSPCLVELFIFLGANAKRSDLLTLAIQNDFYLTASILVKSNPTLSDEAKEARKQKSDRLTYKEAKEKPKFRQLLSRDYDRDVMDLRKEARLDFSKDVFFIVHLYGSSNYGLPISMLLREMQTILDAHLFRFVDLWISTGIGNTVAASLTTPGTFSGPLWDANDVVHLFKDSDDHLSHRISMKFQGKLLSELISENIFYSDTRTITSSEAQSIEKDEELSDFLCSDARDEASVNTFRPSVLDQAFSVAETQGFSPDKVVVLSIGPPPDASVPSSFPFPENIFHIPVIIPNKIVEQRSWALVGIHRPVLAKICEILAPTKK